MTRITSPFGFASTALEVVEEHDLGGRTAIVTGAAGGIGFETARALAAAGAHVTLAVRDLAAGEAAAERLNAELAGLACAGKVGAGRLDLANLAAVAGFAEAWGERPLDLLVNNAGVMACPLGYTVDGLEMQIGVNHFGHFLLSLLLVRSLMNAAQDGRASRVVSLSSIAHRRSAVDFDDPHYRRRPYDKWSAYGQSKTANALFAVGFNGRFADLGVNANAVMPGGIMTGLQRHLEGGEMTALGWLDENGATRSGFKTTEQGAATSVWAAVGSELEGHGGLYLEDCAQALPWSPEHPLNGVCPHALDPEAAERLWALSEDTVGAGL